jgi:hypothetical protein
MASRSLSGVANASRVTLVSLVASILAVALSLGASPARGNVVYLDISGGNGTPLVFSLPQPVAFTVAQGQTPYTFCFQGFHQIPIIPLDHDVIGSYTLNGGSPLPIVHATIVGPPALFTFYSINTGADVGDVLVLSGSVMTIDKYDPSVFATSRLCDAYLAGPDGIIGNGVAIPEPASLSLLALGSATALARRRA